MCHLCDEEADEEQDEEEEEEEEEEQEEGDPEIAGLIRRAIFTLKLRKPAPIIQQL